MDDVLSIAEIRTRYRAEWVLLEDPVATGGLDVEGGRVLWHSKDRDEVYRKAKELRPKHSAVVYTGPRSRDRVVIL